MTKRHSESEKRAIIRQLKLGTSIEDICNEQMISPQTIQRWNLEFDPDRRRKLHNELTSLNKKYAVLKELLIEKELELEKLRSALAEKCSADTY